MTRAVLLDAFGTLLTLDSPVPSLREILAERLGVTVTQAQAGAALAAEVAYYRAHMHLGRDQAAVDELHLRCGEVLRAALPEDPRLQAAAPEQVRAVLIEALRFRVYPEVPDTLARLRDAGLTLVVVSNWDASVEGVLARAGLLALVDGVISSAAVGAAKPDPLPLQRGLERAGASAAEAVHVGDSETEDVDGALAAGVKPVLLRRDGGQSDNCVTIASLAELPALLGL